MELLVEKYHVHYGTIQGSIGLYCWIFGKKMFIMVNKEVDFLVWTKQRTRSIRVGWRGFLSSSNAAVTVILDKLFLKCIFAM